MLSLFSLNTQNPNLDKRGFRYSDLAPFDTLIWPHLTENHTVYSASGSVAPREDRVDRRAKVELFEQIRREYEHGCETIRGIAR